MYIFWKKKSKKIGPRNYQNSPLQMNRIRCKFPSSPGSRKCQIQLSEFLPFLSRSLAPTGVRCLPWGSFQNSIVQLSICRQALLSAAGVPQACSAAAAARKEALLPDLLCQSQVRPGSRVAASKWSCSQQQTSLPAGVSDGSYAASEDLGSAGDQAAQCSRVPAIEMSLRGHG